MYTDPYGEGPVDWILTGKWDPSDEEWDAAWDAFVSQLGHGSAAAVDSALGSITFDMLHPGEWMGLYDPCDPANQQTMMGTQLALLPLELFGGAGGLAAANKTRKVAKITEEVAEAANKSKAIRLADELKAGMKTGLCFAAGTEVAIPGGTLPIEKIKAGDLVWACDERTGSASLRSVLNTVRREADNLLDVRVAGKDIFVTAEHPFWTLNRGWTTAQTLCAGDELLTPDGRALPVYSISLVPGKVPVYNMLVADLHTYYVSDLKILVHNNNCAQQVGEEHHGISKRIWDSLQMNPSLKDKFLYRDPKFVTRAADRASHHGYQTWHRALDKEVADWVRKHPSATREEFEDYLRSLYERPDLATRFPNGF